MLLDGSERGNCRRCCRVSVLAIESNAPRQSGGLDTLPVSVLAIESMLLDLVWRLDSLAKFQYSLSSRMLLDMKTTTATRPPATVSVLAIESNAPRHLAMRGKGVEIAVSVLAIESNAPRRRLGRALRALLPVSVLAIESNAPRHLFVRFFPDAITVSVLAIESNAPRPRALTAAIAARPAFQYSLSSRMLLDGSRASTRQWLSPVSVLAIESNAPRRAGAGGG